MGMLEMKRASLSKAAVLMAGTYCHRDSTPIVPSTSDMLHTSNSYVSAHPRQRAKVMGSFVW